MKSRNIFNYLLLVTIATLPFAGWHFFVLGVPIYMPELIVIIASAVFRWILWHTDTFRIQKLPKSIVASITLLGIGLLSSAFFNGITTVQLGIIKSWFFFPMLFAWLLFQTMPLQSNGVEKPSHTSSFFIQHALLTWYITLTGVSLIALAYFFAGELTYDGRLKAFYLSPNYLALFLFPGVLLGWHFIIEMLDSRLPARNATHNVAGGRGNDNKKGFLFFATIILWAALCTTLYLTLSYTVIIASIFGFFVTLFFNTKHSFFSRKILIILCIGAISLFLLIQTHNQKFSDIIHLNERSSLASRIMIWESSWKMIANHPIFGIGPGNFQTTYLDYQRYFPPYLEWAVPHPHNLYLAFWLQTGIIGLIGFISLIFVWMQNIIRSISTNTKKTPLAKMFLGMMATLLCIGLLDTPYWKNDLAYIFWLMLSIGIYASSREIE